MGVAKSKPTIFSPFELPSPLDDNGVMSLMQEFQEYSTIDPKVVMKLLDDAAAALSTQTSAVVDMDVPEGGSLTVVGDLHGQFFDLAKIFELNGNPGPSNRYIFNGDFVDRGAFVTEVVLTLMSWKVLYPKYVTLLRGNHEIRSVNESYGFKDEVAHKYGDDKIFSKFNNVFCKLPIAALIQQKVFVVHGGLPRAENGMVSIDSLRKLTVDVEPRERSILSDLLWSDPQDEYGVGMSPRNVGILFGPDVTQRFLQANNLDLIVRSHELCADGYRIQEGGKVVTIFSAPNYCGRCGNLAAYAKFDSNLKMTIRQFPATQRPPSPVKGQTPRAPAGAIDRTNSLTRYMD